MRVGAATVAALVVLVGVAQLVLPGIAVERVRDRVGRYGTVKEVHVRAVPAVELLWGDAQEITVKAGELRMSPHQLADLVQNLEGVSKADLSTPRLHLVLSSVASGELTFEDAHLSKRGNTLSASGTARATDLHLAVPAGIRVEGLSAESGRPEVAISGEALGVHTGGRGIVSASDGKLVVEVAGLPFSGLTAATIFSDPRIYVESITASARGQGFLIVLRARPAG
jgi:hypothetical protein